MLFFNYPSLLFCLIYRRFTPTFLQKFFGNPCLRIVRPSLLLGPREEFRLGEKIAVMLTLLLKHFLLGALKKYKPVEAGKVAQFAVKVAHEEPIAGIRIYESN
jgi:hypothetical protein